MTGTGSAIPGWNTCPPSALTGCGSRTWDTSITRQWKQVYRSSVFGWNREVSAGRLSFQAEQPHPTRLSFQVRSSPSSTGLADRAWRPLSEGAFDLSPGDRRLQYRAVLESGNGDLYPVLDRVEVQLK